MRKSFICIFLVFVLVFTLSFSVYADPVNDIPGTYTLSNIWFSFDHNVYYSVDSFDFNLGDIYSLYFYLSKSSSTQYGYKISLNLNVSLPCDIYFLNLIPSVNGSPSGIALYPSYYVNHDTGDVYVKSILSSLTSYSSFNYSGSFSRYYATLTSSDQSISFRSNSGQFYDMNLSYGKIIGLPAGSCYLELECPSYTLSSDNLNVAIPVGIYIDYRSSGNPITDYEAGLISFSDASNQIIDEMNQILDSDSSSDFEKQFAVSIADQDLARLQSVSDAKYSATVNSFSDKSSDILQSYVDSGSTDILSAVTHLNTLFSDSLSQAVTPEQGTLINSLYNVRLSELQAIFDVNFNQYLESIITDSDFENSESYREDLSNAIAVQSEALLIFEESDYQAYLNFESWIADYLSDQNYHPIKDIYDFIFSDPSTSDIQPFLIIPFSLVLLAALLGTVISVSRGKKHG